MIPVQKNFMENFSGLEKFSTSTPIPQKKASMTSVPRSEKGVLNKQTLINQAAQRNFLIASDLSRKSSLTLEKTAYVPFLGSASTFNADTFDLLDQQINDLPTPLLENLQGMDRSLIQMPRSVEFFSNLLEDLRDKKPVDALANTSAAIIFAELVSCFISVETGAVILTAGPLVEKLRLKLEVELNKGNKDIIVSYDNETGEPITYGDTLSMMIGWCRAVETPAVLASEGISFIGSAIKSELEDIGITNEKASHLLQAMEKGAMKAAYKFKEGFSEIS